MAAIEKAPPQPGTHAAPGSAWYQREAADVLRHFEVKVDTGLSTQTVTDRLAKYGHNELIEKGAKSVWAILWEQITNPLVLLLIGAATISIFLGKWDSFIAIVAIVIINAILGVTQEYRAEQAMQALKKMSAPLVRVRRDGKVQDIASRDLVPGDIVLLEAGSIVPADSRLVEAANLAVAEAALTGESQPVEKNIKVIHEADMPLGDRHNLVYMGTAVTYGRGTALVVETGMQTELGKIANLIQSVEAEKTPMQKRIDEVGVRLFQLAIVVMILAFIIGILTGQPILPPGDQPTEDSVLLTAVSIAVAVVPEGLPAVVTVALALGAQRMLKRRALIRKLPAVETLGSVTTICSDKTGTLTENRMTVRFVDVEGEEATIDEVLQDGRMQLVSQNGKTEEATVAQAILMTGNALCNDAILEAIDQDGKRDFRALGDPTEGALVIAAAKYGLMKERLDHQYPRVGEVPFSSERKRMTTIHTIDEASESSMIAEEKAVRLLFRNAQNANEYVSFTKGGVDSILDVCDRVWIDGNPTALTPELRARVEASNDKMAKEGLRVLGLAYRRWTALPEDVDVESMESNLIFVGMVGIIDPPRAEVRDAVAMSRTAGVRPVMITGDHPLTALAIAKELNIAGENDRVLTGHELAKMSQSELESVVEQVPVYARVAPEHKLNIVQALQTRGHIVAMTGDGVNDAPALKKADIGVAMGITGTAVSKEASNMVILDDNFATIVSAVEEGRTIYENVRRFIKYLLASNTGELFVLLMTQLIPNMGLPLTTLQILWMNLITDGIPALALGVEQGERGAMRRAPYPPNESVFGRGLARHIIIVGFTLGLSGLLLGIWAFNQYQTEATTIASSIGITQQQMLDVQRLEIDLDDPVTVSTAATEVGITPEQVVAAEQSISTMNYAPYTWNTMVFIFLTIAQMGHALGLRSHRESTFTLPFFGNKLLLGAVVLTIIVQLLAVYLPFFNDIFGTHPLTGEQLAICIVLSTIVFIVVEIEKLLIRRGVLKSG
ncbi:MAG: cation-translocating P-type ATPase [Chloroflexota bacterium]|nr:cation-translocating P-type ATPase [Chloroflexota bacterium]